MSEDINCYFAMIFAMFLWGASWVAIKIVTTIAPAMILGFFRYTIAGVLFLVLLLAKGRSIRNLFSRTNFPLIFLAGLTGVFGFMVLSVYGTSLTTASQASIIAGTNPITVSFFAHTLHKERLSATWQYIGFVFAFFGVIFVIGIQSLIAFNWGYLVGNLILIGSMLSWGLYSSIAKSAMDSLSPIEVTAGSVFVGLALFGLFMIPDIHLIPALVPNLLFWWSLIFLGALSSFVGFTLYLSTIKKIGATRSGVFIALVPVFGTLTSIALLSDVFYWTFLVGLVLVVAGIIVLNAPKENKNTIPLYPDG